MQLLKYMKMKKAEIKISRNNKMMKEVMMRLKLINYKQSSKLSIVIVKEEIDDIILIKIFSIKVMKNNKSTSFSLSNNKHNRKQIKKIIKNINLLTKITEFNLKA